MLINNTLPAKCSFSLIKEDKILLELWWIGHNYFCFFQPIKLKSSDLSLFVQYPPDYGVQCYGYPVLRAPHISRLHHIWSIPHQYESNLQSHQPGTTCQRKSVFYRLEMFDNNRLCWTYFFFVIQAKKIYLFKCGAKLRKSYSAEFHNITYFFSLGFFASLLGCITNIARAWSFVLPFSELSYPLWSIPP
jgi:hypothetical protein